MTNRRVRYRDDLCGLYTGVPLTERSIMHSGTLPDVITIYREGIIRRIRRPPRPHQLMAGFANRSASPSCTSWAITTE